MRKYRIETRRIALLYMLFFTYALTTSVVGTFMVSWLTDFGIGVSAGGIFTVFQYAGSMAGVFLTGFILARYTKKALCLATFGFLAVLLLMMSKVSCLGIFLVLLFLLGMTSKALDMIVNTTISVQHEENKGATSMVVPSFFTTTPWSARGKATHWYFLTPP